LLSCWFLLHATTTTYLPVVTILFSTLFVLQIFALHITGSVDAVLYPKSIYVRYAAISTTIRHDETVTYVKEHLC
jgi:hypothetical protein